MYIKPLHGKINNLGFVFRDESDQSWHPPSLIRVFNVHMKKVKILNYPFSAQQIVGGQMHWLILVLAGHKAKISGLVTE